MKTATTHKKKFPKWPFIIAAILLALGATGYYFYNKYISQNRWKPLLQTQLKELVTKSTDSLYKIDYSDFAIDLASGDATISNFKLIPDTNVYNKMVAAKKAPDNLFTLNVKKLGIRNMGAKKAYFDKILNVDLIFIDSPNLTIENKRYPFNDTVKVGKPRTPYEIIKETFKELHIDSIAFKSVTLTYINKNSSKIKKSAIKNLNINISDIFIDSLSARDTSRFYYTRGVEVTMNNYGIATPDSLYEAKVDKLTFSTAKRDMVLERASFLPRYNKKLFYQKRGTAGDIFSLSFKKIAINDIDLQRFLRDQKLYAQVLNIDNPNIEIYNNSAYKGIKTSKIGKDPHQALQKLALDMKLSRLNIKNADISYKEANDETGFTGIITFRNTNGYILNMTNDSVAKAANPYMTAHINSRFMNAANLNVNFKFNLLSKAGAFNYNGTLGKFDGRILDTLVRPLAMVQVDSADIQKLYFNVDGSNYAGKGKLEFYYKNLKIALLKKEEGERQLQKKGFLSTIANSFIIEDNNPDKDGKFRPGPINMVRDPKMSFFSFLYKALLDGLKPSVGFDEKTEKKVKNTAATVSNILDKINIFKKDTPEEKKRKEHEKALKEQAEAKKKAAEEQKKKEEQKREKINSERTQ